MARVVVSPDVAVLTEPGDVAEAVQRSAWDFVSLFARTFGTTPSVWAHRIALQSTGLGEEAV